MVQRPANPEQPTQLNQEPNMPEKRTGQNDILVFLILNIDDFLLNLTLRLNPHHIKRAVQSLSALPFVALLGFPLYEPMLKQLPSQPQHIERTEVVTDQ